MFQQLSHPRFMPETPAAGLSVVNPIFAADVIQRCYGIKDENLSIQYLPDRANRDGSNLQISEAANIIGNVKDELIARYESETGKKFNSFQLGEFAQTFREWFWNDSRIAQAFRMLDLPNEHINKLHIPWWNEVGLAERSWAMNGDSAKLSLIPRHSYEAQLLRKGVAVPIIPVVIAGLVRTVPEANFKNGTIVLGLRGGSHLPNIYSYVGGALPMDADLVESKSSLSSVFVRTELREELGLDQKHLKKVTLHSRLFDRLLDQGSAYVFDVQTRLTRDEIRQVWLGNKHPDQQEHKDLLFLPADPHSISGFLQERYVGPLANDPKRPDTKRFLGHQTALALAAEIGMPLEELAKLYCAEPS